MLSCGNNPAPLVYVLFVGVVPGRGDNSKIGQHTTYNDGIPELSNIRQELQQIEGLINDLLQPQIQWVSCLAKLDPVYGLWLPQILQAKT